MGLLVGLGHYTQADKLTVGAVVGGVSAVDTRVLLRPAGDGEGVELTLVDQGVLGPGLDYDVQGLFEQGVVAVLVTAVSVYVELDARRAVGASGDTHIQTSLGHLVQHCQLFGEADGVVVGEDAGALCDAEIVGYGGEVGANLYGAGGGNVIARVPKVMLPDPDTREAGLVV